jgi:hypothetical protein
MALSYERELEFVNETLKEKLEEKEALLADIDDYYKEREIRFKNVLFESLQHLYSLSSGIHRMQLETAAMHNEESKYRKNPKLMEEETKKIGVRYIKNFLQYAKENGKEKNDPLVLKELESMIKEICHNDD